MYTVSKKRASFETIWLKIIPIDFDDIWQKYSKDSRIESVCFIFRAGLLFFINFSTFKPDTKITRILTLYQANAPTLTRCIFLIKHIPRFIIIGTHDPQAFRHNTVANKLLLMQLFLFNFRPNLHRRKWRKLRVALFRTFSTSPAACWCCCSSNLYQETLL